RDRRAVDRAGQAHLELHASQVADGAPHEIARPIGGPDLGRGGGRGRLHAFPDPLQVVRCPTHPRADLLADAAEAELYVALAESEPAAEGVEVEGGHADPG